MDYIIYYGSGKYAYHGELMNKKNVKWLKSRRVNSPFVYTVSMYCLNFIPRWLGHSIGYFIAMAIYIFHRTERLNIQYNLSILLENNKSSFFIKKLSYSIIKNFINSQMDLLKSIKSFLRNKPYAEKITLIKKNDFKPLDDMLSLKRGLILITGHIGLWELGGVILSINGYPLTVVTYRDDKDVLEKKNQMRASLNINTVTIGQGYFESLNIARALRSEAITALLIDRPVTRNTRETLLFGRRCYFSTDFFLLSKISGAPVLPTFIVLDRPGGKYKAIFGKPLVKCSGLNTPETEDYFRYLINLYKNIILEYNSQWYNFYPFFEETWQNDSSVQ